MMVFNVCVNINYY